MSRPIYDMDKPDQKRLKAVRAQIEALLKENDMAGACVLHTPGMCEFFYRIEPSYSVVRVIEREGQEGGLRFSSKLDRDHGGDLEEQKRSQRATANMAAGLAESMARAGLMFIDISRAVDKTLHAEHGPSTFVEDPR